MKKSTAQRKRRKRSSAFWSVPLSLLMLGLLAFMYTWAQDQVSNYADFQKMRAVVHQQTFYDGISVDGVPLGGLTYDEALSTLRARDTETASAFSIILQSGNRKWRISSDEVPLTLDTEAVLQKAYALGRKGRLEERYAEIQSLKMQGAAYMTSFSYDRNAVRHLTDQVATALTAPGWDASVASFDAETKSFTFHPEQAGQTVDADRLYARVIEALDQENYGATLTVDVQEVLPAQTVASLSASYGLIARYSSTTTTDKKRNTNISLAAQAVNGVVLQPGEVISYNACTGERTPAKGYQEAAAIRNGQSITETGGGVCQTSTTLFNALVRAGLTIVERRPHAWPATYVPRGEDAMVDWPGKDLKMRNDSQGTLYILAWYADQTVTVEVYGMSLGDGIQYELYSETTYTQKPPDEPLYTQNATLPVGTQKEVRKARTGYSVQTYLVITRNGQEISREKLYKSEYKMYQQEFEFN